ncbi:hypothetical protein BRADI_5g10085v3 [Brachypodium distachyon]|uniref:Uncharacterized protein n=1 Tax=Brachypodium distachyon TaxID=15368 RepID=A0A2K2CGB9_BRADI|nr:hypothetical protein BRADI_5g10085v3 [Brachypodium distachyon]
MPKSQEGVVCTFVTFVGWRVVHGRPPCIATIFDGQSGAGAVALRTEWISRAHFITASAGLPLQFIQLMN